MKKYIFVFGRDPKLSYAELISYFKTLEIKYELEYFEGQVAVFSLNKLIEINDLGGTVKIAEVILENKIKNIDFYLGSKNRVNYGISYYNRAYLLEEFEDVLKSWFKKEKIKAMRKKSKENHLDPKELVNILEFIVCSNYIGRTISVSNPKEYKKRDKNRKYNDFKISISIRLAKILLNLSGAKKGKKVLDPFCGVGILLEEAILRNIECVGVDLDGKTKNKAVANLRSLGKKNFKVIVGNSSKIDNYFSKNSIDCVASEPFMGPYFKTYPQKREAIKVIKELNELYEKFFISLKKILKNNCKVAMVLPVIKASNRKKYRLNLEKIFRKSGFKILKLDDIEFPLLYQEKKSIIEREIYVLE